MDEQGRGLMGYVLGLLEFIGVSHCYLVMAFRAGYLAFGMDGSEHPIPQEIYGEGSRHLDKG